MDPSKIMIVEDNTTVAEDCRDCLESLGYAVTSIVSSGEESIEKVEAERPDCVIMDIYLRDEMDGTEAAEQIHSRFEIPVVFLTAYSDPDLIHRIKRVSSFGYLVKPVNERELYAALEIAIHKAKAEKKRGQMEVLLRQAQKMEAIAILAGGIAHQFNNALYVITGNLELLEMEFFGDENITNYAKKIKASASRMTQLVDQLLAYARCGKYHIKTLSLSDFVRDTLPLVKDVIAPGIYVDTEFPSDLFKIEADPTQVQMVLFALMVNASEAMDGKKCIRISCKNTMIPDGTGETFSGLKHGDYVCLTITDDGRGMDQETRKRIFEPFFTTNFDGRGLGMAAVYGIVKNHGGWIAVDSEPGEGTVVKIYFPAIRPQVEEPEKTKIDY